MKKIRLILFFSLLLSIALWSCKKDEAVVSYKSGTNPVLTADDTSIQLNALTPSAEAIALSWTNPNYVLSNGISSLSVVYAIDIDTVGSNFSNPNTNVATITSNLSTTYTQNQFDSLLVNRLNLKYGKTYNIIIRVQSSLGSNAAVLNSNVLEYDSVTPYRILKVYPSLYVPGDYQGWAPGNAPSIASTNVNSQGQTVDNKYEGYLYVPSSAPSLEFKFTNYPDWNHTAYGVGASPNALSSSGGNLLFAQAPATPATASGFYHVTADLSALTWSGEIETWAIMVGSTSIPLTYNASTNKWVATNVSLTTGTGFTFQANGLTDAAHNFGVDNSGDFVNGGSSIPVTTSGNYTVTLDLSIAGNYTYSLQ